MIRQFLPCMALGGLLLAATGCDGVPAASGQDSRTLTSRERRETKERGTTIYSSADKSRVDQELVHLNEKRKETVARLEICEKEQKQGLADHSAEIVRLKQGISKIDGLRDEQLDMKKRLDRLDQSRSGNEQTLKELDEKWRKLDQESKTPPPPPPPEPKTNKDML